MALKLQIILEAVDRLTAPVERVRARVASLATPINAIASATARLGRAGGVDALGAAMGRVAGGAQQVVGALGQISARAAALGAVTAGVGLAVFNSQFISGAADMQEYRTMLTRMEGSAAGAERALSWISDFSRRTPFELAEVTSAFVDMRNLGLDPTQGALNAAGDAAAAMRTRYGEAVSALSAAMRGEMDPLERFGVFARTQGENIVLNWEHHGRQMTEVVDKNNRQMLARAVQRAWTQKFGGAMDDLSRQWRGMLSNLRDAWSRWTLAVMNSGVMDWLQGRLARLLAFIDAAGESGQLQAWAESTASAILRAFNAVERFVLGYDEIVEAGNQGGTQRIPSLFERITSALATASDAFDRLHAALSPIIGPFSQFDVALTAIGVALASPLIGRLAALTGGFVALGAALISNPVGWAILAIGAIATLGTLLYQNWDKVLPWFLAQWEALPGPVQNALSILTAPIRGLIVLVDLLRDAWNGAAAAAERLQDLLPSTGQSPTGPANDPAAQQLRRDNWRNRSTTAPGAQNAPSLNDLPAIMGQGVGPTSYAPMGSSDRVDVGGTLRIRIEDGRVTTSGRMNDPRARLDVDQGLLVAPA